MTKYLNSKFLWLALGVGIITCSLYILFVSDNLTFDADPDSSRIILFAIQKILIGLLFFLAVINIKKLPITEQWIAFIIFTGLLARMILLPSVPALENDYYRYLWDGAVTANGVNPYSISPQQVMDKDTVVPERIIHLAEESGEVIHKINHPKIRTLYPALSQAVFSISYIFFPWSVSGFKIIMLLADLLLLFFIIGILKELKLPKTFIAIYWLNPIVIHQFFSAVHYDLFAVLFTAISFYYFLKSKYISAGIILAIAVGFKLYPVLILPFYLRKITDQKIKFALTTIVFAVIVFVIFIPVLLAGFDENQGLIKYAANWINNAAFYTLLKDSIDWFTTTFKIYYVCADCVARWITVAIMLLTIIGLNIKQAKSNKEIANKIVIAFAVMFLISPTQFPWYFTWLVVPLTFSPKFSLLMYSFLLPLYHLNYLGDYFIYIQHIPVFLLFLYEITNKRRMEVIFE